MSHSARRTWTLLWGLVVPHSFVLIGRAMRARFVGRRRLERFAAEDGTETPVNARAFDYEEAVDLLVSMGCDEEAIRSGSIQDDSLRFVRQTITQRLAGSAPLKALHVGNFVGLSLASLTGTLIERDPDSTVVSVDPNLMHGGIEQTQACALAVLAHFGLQRNSLLICGYSLERVPGNDGIRGIDSDPLTASAAACEDTLVSLARIGARFDVVLMDGHHDAEYLRRELTHVQAMLAEGGLLFLDDVSTIWKGIRELFRELSDNDSSWPFEQIGYNGRVGALRKRNTAHLERSTPAIEIQLLGEPSGAGR
jgi:hypothetical protein